MTKEKIWFIQFLRAVACLSVVIAHFIILWIEPDAIDAIFFNSHALIAGPHWIIGFFNNGFYTIIGITGVAIFFIISGFIIPFSMTAISIKHFITHRFFRIYPPLIVPVSITFICYSLVGYIRGEPTLINLYSAMASMTLLNSLFKVAGPFPGVLWTLAIEVKFYAILAIINNSTSSNILKMFWFCLGVVLIKMTPSIELWWISYVLVYVIRKVSSKHLSYLYDESHYKENSNLMQEGKFIERRAE